MLTLTVWAWRRPKAVGGKGWSIAIKKQQTCDLQIAIQTILIKEEYYEHVMVVVEYSAKVY